MTKAGQSPGAVAAWHPDPWVPGGHRWWNGTDWTPAASPPPPVGPHPTLPVQMAIGALVATAVPVVASRYLLRGLAAHQWPVALYVVIAGLIGYGPAVAWCVYASRRWGSGSLRADIGLRWKASDLGWGPLTWLSCLVSQVIVGSIVVATKLPFTSNTEGIGRLRADRGYVISLLVLAVVAAPIVEEIVFRGAVLRGLLSVSPPAVAIGAQATLFGIAHFDPIRGSGNVGLIMVLSGVGAVLGTAAYLTRRIVPSMVAHAILNGLAMALVLSGWRPGR